MFVWRGSGSISSEGESEFEFPFELILLLEELGVEGRRRAGGLPLPVVVPSDVARARREEDCVCFREVGVCVFADEVEVDEDEGSGLDVDDDDDARGALLVGMLLDVDVLICNFGRQLCVEGRVEEVMLGLELLLLLARANILLQPQS